MDVDAIVSLLSARIPELSDVDRAEIEAAIRGRPPPVLLDKDMAERLMAVIEALEDRVAGMIGRVEVRHVEEEREAAFIDAAGETLQ